MLSTVWSLFLITRLLCAAGDCPGLDSDGCDGGGCSAGCCQPADTNTLIPRIAERPQNDKPDLLVAIIPDTDVAPLSSGDSAIPGSASLCRAGRPYPPSDLPLLI